MLPQSSDICLQKEVICYHLFSKRVNVCQMDSFFERGRMNGCHLTRIGCYSGLVVPISSIVGLELC